MNVCKALLRYCVLLFLGATAQAQHSDFQIKVLGFEEGLSHRNVFKIQQDRQGFLWIATINGLNRYDGYRFLHYNQSDNRHFIPADYVSDLLIDRNNRLWPAHPRQLTLLRPERGSAVSVPIPEGSLPANLCTAAAQDLIWATLFDEKTGEIRLQSFDPAGPAAASTPLPGKYTRRPLAVLGPHLYAGAWENELWQIDAAGNPLQKWTLPTNGRVLPRIVHLQAKGDSLFVLSSDSRLYSFHPQHQAFTLHPLSQLIKDRGKAVTMNVLDNGDAWVAGENILWYYNASSRQVTDLDKPIRQTVKNYLQYRQVFSDRTGVVWVASDFGLIKIVQSVNLFTKYLSGGNEYCSDGFCSTRGIAEDDRGRIYISYYNSIHVLDPRTEYLRPLFAANEYNNSPYGLIWHDDALYTGNGLRIDLTTMQVDTLLEQGAANLASVCRGKDGAIWFGYRNGLHRYDPKTRKIQDYPNWPEPGFDGEISYVYSGKTGHHLWVGTLEHGVYLIDIQNKKTKHYHTGDKSPARLACNEVNAVYEDNRGQVWFSTTNGLHRLRLSDGAIRIYTDRDGLPNNILAGFLPEGDSCLWISTFRGLCRFNIVQNRCVNFFETDGLSHNEFNRTSFFQSRDGRMYFGGLDGVNAFYPGPALADFRSRVYNAPLLFTGFSRFDGDSLYLRSSELRNGEEVVLSHRDRMFGFRFAIADFRQSSDKQFSYRLEGYEDNWSPASTVNEARYNNIPAGRYLFRVRARSGNNDWSSLELAAPVFIRQAYYLSWPFLAFCALLLLGGAYGVVRYRIYQLRRRERALERVVQARTQQLEAAKQESETLLLNILPAQIAEELKRSGKARAQRHEQATVLFSDFRDFSSIAEKMDPEHLVAEIDTCFRAFDEIIDRHGLEKIKTIGDAYMCMVIDAGADGPQRMVQAALDIQYFLARHAAVKQQAGEPFFEARIGIHTGAVVAGVVGSKKFAYDIWGDTVNIASRMESSGEVGRVNITGATYELVKNNYRCTHRGRFSTRRNRETDMYFVEV